MNEQKDSVSEGVSEAAPERIWLFQMAGMGGRWVSTESESAKANYGVEYVRVHQPPEQNSEDKNSVSPKPKAPSHSSVVISGDSSLKAAHTWTRAFPGKDGYFWMRFADPPSEAMMVEVTVMGNLRETGMVGDVRNRVDIGACEFLGPIPLPPITQDGASASALSTTVPDHGQASLTESSESESESTLVTVDEALEDAAKIADSWEHEDKVNPARYIAKAIRALISKPPTSPVQVDEVSKEQDNAKS